MQREFITLEDLENRFPDRGVIKTLLYYLELDKYLKLTIEGDVE